MQNAPTNSLFGVMNRILDESIERKYDDMPKVQNSDGTLQIYHLAICYILATLFLGSECFSNIF